MTQGPGGLEDHENAAVPSGQQADREKGVWPRGRSTSAKAVLGGADSGSGAPVPKALATPAAAAVAGPRHQPAGAAAQAPLALSGAAGASLVRSLMASSGGAIVKGAGL
jgi:hypothetical protein